jgi:hypothetical protein
MRLCQGGSNLCQKSEIGRERSHRLLRNAQFFQSSPFQSSRLLQINAPGNKKGKTAMSESQKFKKKVMNSILSLLDAMVKFNSEGAGVAYAAFFVMLCDIMMFFR